MSRICYHSRLNLRICIHPGDHPPPHFHVYTADGEEAVFSISPVECLLGTLPIKKKSWVFVWAEQNKKQLLENWELARQKLPLKQIEP